MAKICAKTALNPKFSWYFTWDFFPMWEQMWWAGISVIFVVTRIPRSGQVAFFSHPFPRPHVG